MFNPSALPVHPSKRHPLTGQPLQAIWVRPDGRVMWPILGGDDTVPPAGTGTPPTGGGGAAAPPAPAAAGARTNAVDGQGNDLGYPKDTPLAEMNDKEQASYWRHYARTHENKWKDLAGDKKPEEIKAALDKLSEIEKAQQTPAEQALSENFEKGKAEGLKAARAETAATVFRGALEAAQLKAEDIDELVTNLNVANFVTDNGVDTTKLTNFAKRFTAPATGNQQQQRRDFGGGSRQDPPQTRGAGGKAEAERRFGKKQNQS